MQRLLPLSDISWFALIVPSNEHPYDPVLLDDSTAGAALRIFLVLSQRPEIAETIGCSPETIFWSRYYWFRRFALERQASHGPDAGLEQQAFRLLEHPEPECRPDWSLLAWVEEQASRGTLAGRR